MGKKPFSQWLVGRTLRRYGQVLSDVGITFSLRKVLVGLYSRIDWRELLSMAAVLAILVGTRLAVIRFPPGTSGV